jgi:hypothetical protein
MRSANVFLCGLLANIIDLFGHIHCEGGLGLGRISGELRSIIDLQKPPALLRGVGLVGDPHLIGLT